jgi:hypothetical protein
VSCIIHGMNMHYEPVMVVRLEEMTASEGQEVGSTPSGTPPAQWPLP